jgi:transcriptional regulator with XRE-family HTH domain
MDYEEFRRQLGKAGLTAKDFAELVKLNRNSITNYAQSGTVPSHLAVIAALLGEMAEHKIDFRGVLSRIEITPNKPRGMGVGTFGGNKKCA